MKIPTCRHPGCRADLRWVLSKNGKRMPLDLKPHPQGNVEIVDGIGNVLGGEPLEEARRLGVDLFLMHRATCKHSEAFARRR